MTSVVNPTYLLAPNWNYKPGGPIALGNIIADPFKPHRPLSQPAGDTPIPNIQHSIEYDWYYETEKIRDINLGLWTQILDIASFNAGARRNRGTVIRFEMSQLDTIYFAEDPTAESVSLRARDIRVRTALKIGHRFLHGTVYMISGLKIARGFTVTKSNTEETGAQVGAGAMVVPEISAGANLDATSGSKKAQGSQAGEDIIFAYQLIRIQPKGRIESFDFKLEEFRHKAAFLGDDDLDQDNDDFEVPQLETMIAHWDDLAKAHIGHAACLDDDQDQWLFRDS